MAACVTLTPSGLSDQPASVDLDIDPAMSSQTSTFHPGYQEGFRVPPVVEVLDDIEGGGSPKPAWVSSQEEMIKKDRFICKWRVTEF